jgi:hypothetical protein
MRTYGISPSFGRMEPHLRMLLPLLVIELLRISMAAASGALMGAGGSRVSHPEQLQMRRNAYFATGVVLLTKVSNGL